VKGSRGETGQYATQVKLKAMDDSGSSPKIISIAKAHNDHGDALQSALDALLDLLANKIVERLRQTDKGNVHQCDSKLLDVHQASEILGLSKHWLYKNSDRLPFTVKVGGALRFERHGLEHWLKMRRK